MESPEMTRIYTFSLLTASPAAAPGDRPREAQTFFVPGETLVCPGDTDTFLQEPGTGGRFPEPLVLRASAGEEICLRLLTQSPAEAEKGGPDDNHLLSFSDENGDLPAPEPVSENRAGHQIHTWQFPARDCPGFLLFQSRLPCGADSHNAFGVLLVEEAGSSFHDIRTGARLPCGTKAVIRRGQEPAFREYVLFVHDLSPSGPRCINYRAEPVEERLKTHADPAYTFSSRVHRDPATPILEAYPGDPVVIRIFGLTPRKMPSFRLFGMACRAGAPTGTGFSEIHISSAGRPGDYLYFAGTPDEAWDGLWGIFRVHPKQKKRLLPLREMNRRSFSHMPGPGKGDRIRRYSLTAVPDRSSGAPRPEWIFVSGTGRKTPVLAAEAGDWLEVTLTNRSPALHGQAISDPERNIVNLFQPVHGQAISRRVSLHPEGLSCDPVCASGINVGYNKMEQTVPPGGRITYLWHADGPCGHSGLFSFGDLRLLTLERPGVSVRISPRPPAPVCLLRSRLRSAGTRIARLLAPFTHAFRHRRKN